MVERVQTNVRFTRSEQLNGTLIVHSQPCPDLSLLDFLRRAHGKRRIHWENERDPLAFAGYGVALELVATGNSRFEAIESLTEAVFARVDAVGEAMPLLFGGFAFRDDFVAQVVWNGMESAHFVLPTVMLRQDGQKSYLVVSEYVPVGTDIQQAKSKLASRFETLFDDLFWNFTGSIWNPEWEEASDIEYPMTFSAWKHMINNATSKMQYGFLDKVVLARMCQVRFNNPVNVVRALEYLREQYAECYRFLFEPQAHNAFYGATPETLVHVNEHIVKADALAGTVKRGQTPAEDATLSEQILSDPKERREHDFVVQGLREALTPFVESVEAKDTPGLLRLRNVQHLFTPVSGELNGNYGVLPLVKALHPTPALGGKPADIANDLIAELEPITRGWYAAPIGWIDSKMNGHFGVGIRSAISREGTLWCYAGAGIVAESTPQREWDETDLKFRPMLSAVGIET